MAEGAMDIRRRKFAIRLSHLSRTCGLRFRGRENSNGWLTNLRRGLSTRDIEDAFPDGTGGSLLSRAAVSESRRAVGQLETCDQTRF